MYFDALLLNYYAILIDLCHYGMTSVPGIFLALKSTLIWKYSLLLSFDRLVLAWYIFFPPFYFQPIFLYLYLKDVNCQQQHIAGFCFFNFSLLFGGCRQFIFNLIIYTVMFKLILFPVFYLTHLFLACGFLILPPFGTSTFCSLVFLLLAC